MPKAVRTREVFVPKLKLFTIVVVAVLCGSIYPSMAAPVDTVDPEIKEYLKNHESANVMISLVDVTEKVNEKLATMRFASENDRKQVTMELKRQFTGESQKPVVQYLEREFEGKKIKTFWITNQIFLGGVTNESVGKLDNAAQEFSDRILRIRLEEKAELLG